SCVFFLPFGAVNSTSKLLSCSFFSLLCFIFVSYFLSTLSSLDYFYSSYLFLFSIHFFSLLSSSHYFSLHYYECIPLFSFLFSLFSFLFSLFSFLFSLFSFLFSL